MCMSAVTWRYKRRPRWRRRQQWRHISFFFLLLISISLSHSLYRTNANPFANLQSPQRKIVDNFDLRLDDGCSVFILCSLFFRSFLLLLPTSNSAIDISFGRCDCLLLLLLLLCYAQVQSKWQNKDCILTHHCRRKILNWDERSRIKWRKNEKRRGKITHNKMQKLKRCERNVALQWQTTLTHTLEEKDRQGPGERDLTHKIERFCGTERRMDERSDTDEWRDRRARERFTTHFQIVNRYLKGNKEMKRENWEWMGRGRGNENDQTEPNQNQTNRSETNGRNGRNRKE